MLIDRSKFLWLTGALSACTAASTTPTPTPATTAPDAGTTDDGGTTKPDTGTTACLGDDGAQPTCDLATADATCRDFCTRFSGPTVEGVPTYTAGVARSITDCILAKPSCGALTDAEIHACTDPALAQACDDPTATTFCEPLVTACDGVTPPDGGSTTPFTKSTCEKLAKALTSAGRETFTSCVMEGTGCSSDPGKCVDALELAR